MDDILCAHCGAPVDLDDDRISVAMTSRNTALIFHLACLEEMHRRAYMLDTDQRAAVLYAVMDAMDEVTDDG